MTSLRLRNLTDRWWRVTSLLEIDPVASLRDPVRALRVVASAGEATLRAFLETVLEETPGTFADEDEERLFATAVFAVLARAERARYRYTQLHGYTTGTGGPSIGDDARVVRGARLP